MSASVETDDDLRLMRAALAFGRRSMGRAAPNPAVGALVVKSGSIVGRGVTAPGGRPHAEPLALAAAGDAARGATLYVTLEPCSHHGRSPPCVDAVLRSGVSRVVVALGDPDPRVAGRGIAQLRAAGLDVIEGVAAAEARNDHLGHLLRVTAGRPMVTLKMAETADGYAAAPLGSPRLMISGPAAQAAVQRLRLTHDAVLVGRGTALVDDPMLTVRLPGLDEHQPLRIVMDRELALPLHAKLVRTAGQSPVWLLASPAASAVREAALAGCGATVIRTLEAGGVLDLAAALEELGSRGLTRVLCEGGPALASALLMTGLADRVVMLTSRQRLDGPGMQALTASARARVMSGKHFSLLDEAPLGSDVMRVYGAIEHSCSPD